MVALIALSLVILPQSAKIRAAKARHKHESAATPTPAADKPVAAPDNPAVGPAPRDTSVSIVATTAAQTTVVTRASPRDRALDLALSFDAGPREMSFAEDLFGRFAGYSLPFLPTVSLRANYHPGAHFSRGVASWFGIDVRATYGFTFQTTVPTTGAMVSTQSFALGGGLVFRVPLGPFELSALGLVEYRAFTFSGDAGTARTLSVRYVFIEPALRLRVFLPAGLSLTAEGGYLGMLDAGLARDFPRVAGNGVVASIVFGWTFAAGVGVQIGGELRQIGLDFRSRPGDPYALGGALDRQITGRVGVTWSDI